MAQDIIARGLAIKALEEGGGGGGDHPVTSVNGKTGAVVLTATDVKAVATVNGKTGTVTLGAADVGAATEAYVDEQVEGISFPVTSVNNKTGAITLTAGDVGATTKSYVDTQINGITYPVTSVNGKTGAITLTAGDVGATTKTYVDDQIKAIKYPVISVNGKTGAVTLAATDVGATTEAYVNSKVGDVTPLTVTLTENAATGTYTSNTTYVDIKDAYDAGVPINVSVGGTSRLPLMNVEFSGDDAGFTFGYTQVQSDGNAVVTRAIHYLHTATEDTWEDADAESQSGGGSGVLGDTTIDGTLTVTGAVENGLNINGNTKIIGTINVTSNPNSSSIVADNNIQCRRMLVKNVAGGITIEVSSEPSGITDHVIKTNNAGGFTFARVTDGSDFRPIRIGDPVNANDAATKKYVDSIFSYDATTSTLTITI